MDACEAESFVNKLCLSVGRSLDALLEDLDAVLKQHIKGDDTDCKKMSRFIHHVLKTFPTAASFLKDFVDRCITALDALDNVQLKTVGEPLFDCLLQSYPTMHSQIYSLGLLLSETHQAEGDLYSAVQTLAKVNTDADEISLEAKCELFIRAAEFSLEMDDHVNADKFLKKMYRDAKHLRNANSELFMRYRTSYTRVIDSMRRFLEASRKYFELSEILELEEDRLVSLEKAVTCAILAKAGQGRSKMLHRLYKDERVQKLANYEMLKCVALYQIVRKENQSSFEKMLSETQNVKTATGLTVLQNSMIEHNLLSASRLYKNISIEQLASLLGTSTDTAELIASKMIKEKRLFASIDDVDGFIDFYSNEQPLKVWERGVEQLCYNLDSLVNEMEQIQRIN